MNTTSSTSARRFTSVAGRALATTALAAGAALALATPALAADGGVTSYDQPSGVDLGRSADVATSNGCTYYHVYVNGQARGAGYGCPKNSPETRSYRAWVVCSDSRRYDGPYTHRGYISYRLCPTGTSAKYGGYEFA
ncbi:hypothetical protein [Actinomycetospora chiangmaiensis]|uniref:hypothetical protein n=1 Tax=Actinomycetospora chiangmaiensis TaxID=402650 RepID=UPI00035DB9C0|nr:hypothetical protein [Actinomycetospora chiangmaiensis]